MNVQHDTTTRAEWRNAWRLVRKYGHQHRQVQQLLAVMRRQQALLFLTAMQAHSERHSHTVALMSRPVPRSIDANWLIDFRCSRYAATSGRLPA